MSISATQKHWLLSKTLLKKLHKGNIDTFQSYLTEQDLAAFNDVEYIPQSIDTYLSYQSFLSQFHPIRIYESVKELPEEMQDLTFSSLPENQIANIQKRFTLPIKQIPECYKKLFMKKLLEHMYEKMPIVQEFDPNAAHDKLLQLPSYLIIRLCDLLGMYDLSIEIRHVINQKMLQNIYHAITDTQSHFLRRHLQSSEYHPDIPKLNLSSWSGDKTSLSKAIHYRGLIRFCVALSNYESSVLKFLSYKLDPQRSEFLNDYTKTNIDERLAQQMSILLDHALETITSYQPKGA